MKRILVGLCISLCLIACQNEKSSTEIEWIFVKGGPFTLGQNQFVISPAGDTIRGLSSPKRKVRLDDFYIGKYEITVAQFKQFCKETNREMPAKPQQNAYGLPISPEWNDELPMMANWSEAAAFAEWAGGRLPTEAEWEYAAKGGDQSMGFTYSGSNDARETGWVGENSDSTMHAVGLLKPNELGIYDMTGNLSEWVSDWFNPELDRTSDSINPKGPLEGKDNMKISKGVSWFYDATNRATNKPLAHGIHQPEVRYQSPIDTRNDGFGFRIAKD